LSNMDCHVGDAMIIVSKACLPHLASLRIRQVRAEGRSAWLDAHVATDDGWCSACESMSVAVAQPLPAGVGTRIRWPADAAAGSGPQVLLRQHRLSSADLPRAGTQPTTPYARRTPLLRGILEKLALALDGRPGALAAVVLLLLCPCDMLDDQAVTDQRAVGARAARCRLHPAQLELVSIRRARHRG
jgi:hypothetical protein